MSKRTLKKMTRVKETIPPTGQFLSELEVGDWFTVRPNNAEAGIGLRERTLCVLVSTGQYRSYHNDALAFIPSLGMSVEMKEGRAVEHVHGVTIQADDPRPDNPARSVREPRLVEDGRLTDAVDECGNSREVFE